MVDNGSSHHRHAPQQAPRDGRRRLLLIAVGVLVAIAAVLVVSSWDGSGDAVEDRAAATRPASSAPSSPPATTPTPTPTLTETAATPEVPTAFADAMEQIGIPLDPHTGWVLADGICVRLAQPEYDQYRMAEGIERLFPSVSDDQAHDFVAMVAESVCGV